MFTCCLNRALNLSKPKRGLDLVRHDVTRESVAALTDHYADAFVREKVARVFGVVSVRFRLESGKICKITITHYCFIAKTLAGSLKQLLSK